MRRVRTFLALIEGYAPTRREWGAIAIEAARQAGLCAEDLASLRTNLENEWSLEREAGRVASNRH